MAIYTSKSDPGRHRIVIYYGSPDGKPHDEIFRGTKAEAKTFHAKKEIELRGVVRLVRSGPAPIFSDFCLERYAPQAQIHLGAKTWANRKYQLATLNEFFGSKRLDRISVGDIEAFQAERKKDGIGNVKVNDDVKKLLVVLNYAASLGLAVSIPKYKALPERATKGRVKVWTEQEVATLYAAFRKEAPNLLPITVAMLNSGLRKGEALALEWSCVDLKRGMLKIYPNEEWRPKDNEPREVPIGKALRPWLQKERQHPRWVFPTLPSLKQPQGDRYTAWPQKQWDRARKESGVGGSPHVCRHTFASHFLANGGTIYMLAKILGHSTTKVTQLYEHLLPSYLEDARDVVCLPAPLGVVARGPRGRR